MKRLNEIQMPPIFCVVCENPLGMQNGDILDNMITVSSSAQGKNKEKVRYNCCSGM